MIAGSIAKLKNEVKGQVVSPDDSNYDEVRAVWNAMIDRRPAVIVRCAETADSLRALQFARDNGLEIAIRGAGHNIAGNGACEGGMLIDHSNMRSVRVDEGKKRAFVEPGATLGDFDAAIQAHGLATPVGINSTTGIAGLTLGGGFGWLTRKYGMTVDNLVSADVTLANGDRVRASEKENPDLFWAIRGGGGNFGIVTQFEYRLFPLGPEILAGLMVFPIAQAKQVLERFRDLMAEAPEELNIWVVLRKAPPLPFLPNDVHGKEVIVLAVFYGGDVAEGEKLIAPLHGYGDPYGTHIGPVKYVDWQRAFDPLLTPGARNYWKSHNLRELANGALDSIVEYANRLPSPQCEVFVAAVSGAANRVPSDAMAYGHRDTNFVLNVHSRWNAPSEDEKCVSWARNFFNATQRYASSGAYINFMTEDETGRVKAAFGANYARLVEIKKKYDPDNVFHLNQNLRP